MCPKKKNPLFLLFLIFFLSRSIYSPAQNVSFDSSSVPQDSLLTVSSQAGIKPKDKITPEDSSQVVESHEEHRQVLLDKNAFKPRFTLMKLSGAESLSVVGNIFLGQTESPFMIKAYLEKMNRSEILLVMAGGMATLAGGVLAVYINFLGGDDPVQRLLFAKHLLTASVMAAPGVVVISKILVPQTEDISKDAEISRDVIGQNVLDAISNGTKEGVRLAVNVAAMLLVFLAFILPCSIMFLQRSETGLL